MSKEKEVKEENPFEGFNLLKDDALAAPEKEVKAKKETTESKEVIEDNDDTSNEDVFDSAKKEVDEIISKKSNKKSEPKEEVEEEYSSDETEEEEEESEEGSLKPFISHMANKGLLDWDENDEEFEDSEEYLEKIQAKTITNGIYKWRSGYDEDTQKYLEFVENGGRPSDFHKYYYNDSTFSGLRLEGDEEAQKHVIREGLIAAGWEDEDEINDEISLYEDAGKLEAKAESHLKRLQKLEGEQKDILVASQKRYAEEQKEAKRQEWDSFKKGLFEREEISGFKFNSKTKQDLWDYMTKVVDKKTGATAYQKDSIDKGPEARYIFAYLMKNNWDASKLEKNLKNKVVSEVKKKLSNYSDGRSKIKSGTSREEKEQANSFAGFRKLAV
jgi:hypothetical protein